MRISLDWIADFVDLDLAEEGLADRLAEGLLLAGLEVEAVERPGEDFAGFLVAEVLTAGPHPNADQLKVCRVHDGAGERRIVCGAPNVAAGQRVVLAPPGVRLPGGDKIKAARIRGERSEGIICSERELGLGDDHSGILVLEGDPPIGSPAAAALGLDAVVFDISITPNRADCLSVLGVAREAAALLGRPFALPEMEVREEDETEAGEIAPVEILDPDRCPRYVARFVRGVSIGPSPGWMQRRLRVAGMRPINNVVDVTNYVMLTLGQPLHAFDMDLLAGPRVVVRCWRPEDGPFTTLDGQAREMDAEDLMICDGAQPVAVGGVMGGGNSEVGAGTRNILLESAYFTPATIRRTRRRLGLNTEASYRFERGVDPGGTRRAADWAIELIRRSAGGRVARGAVDAHPAPVAPARVRLRPARVSALLGEEIGAGEMREALEAIGMGVEEAGGDFEVEVPTFRPDVEREIDLIEEVARRRGYDRFPATLPAASLPPAPPSPLRRIEGEAREAMTAAGFNEALNYSFVSRDALARLGRAGEDVVPIRNPLSAEMDVMRTSLLAGLLANAALNLNRGLERVHLFEIGRTFHGAPGGGSAPREVTRLAALAAEDAPPALWPQGPAPGGKGDHPPLLFGLKGALESLAEALRLPPLVFETLEGGDESAAFEPGAAAAVRAGEAQIGVIGSLARAVSEGWGIRQPAAVFEVDLEAVSEMERLPLRLAPLPRHPANLRDLAVVVGEEVPHAEVESHIREAGGDLLESVRLFDIYRSGPLAQGGEKSLAYSLVFRRPDRTIPDAEANAAIEAILARLADRLGARLRA
ncbi:MAG: phenylalanine--tRNA ligase subunit beta [bacterium]